MPTAPEQLQQPTTFTGTQACEAAYSFAVPCYPHSLFGIPAPHNTLTGMTKLLVLLQDMVIVFPLWRYWSINVLKAERNIYHTIRIINIMNMSTPGWRSRLGLVPVLMYLGCGINANMTTLTLNSLFSTILLHL